MSDQAKPLEAHYPSLGEATRVWWKIGLFSFGGPAGQIALMHREVVDNRNWISDQRFLNALNFCALLPGPEAQQLATYLGWLLHGAKGGWIAGLLFILPGATVMLALSILFVTLGDVPAVSALFFGVKAAVLVIVLEALIKVSKRALKTPWSWIIAAGAFIALFVFDLPFPLVLLTAGVTGAAASGIFAVAPKPKGVGQPALLDRLLETDPNHAERLKGSARRAGLSALALWLIPVAALVTVGGLWGDIAWFFSKMAVVTFGGAYAVLAYVAQQAVEGYGWLSAAEMLTGLGLAETTPGPLILVLEFVGFLAGEKSDGLGGGVIAAALTLWVTFAPCFAFVFLGAPMIEQLQTSKRLSGALAAITAAVVGVIANLALWFGLRVIFEELRRVDLGIAGFDLPLLESLDLSGATIVVLAAILLFVLKRGLLTTLGTAAIAGMILKLATGL